MIRKIGFAAVILALVLTIFRFGLLARAAPRPSSARDLITSQIDENRRVTLRGNTRPEANRNNDRGPVPDNFPLEHMLLQLRRPPELQQEFDAYVDSLTQGSSPNFHNWLEPAQVGTNYGLSESDLHKIEHWLESYGIRVNFVYPNRVVMDISGTAWQLREAIHVEIHYLEVKGEQHFANMNDPSIPEALAPAVVGIVSIHDFRPHPMVRRLAQYTYTDASGTWLAVTPADLAAIYNLNPLFSQGITGAGQTVAVVEDSDPYTPTGKTNTADWTTFENEFKLTQYGGSISVTHPNAGGNCTDPGDNTDDGEVELDMQYASAAAPGAIINVATCTDTATFGGLIAVENIVAASPHPYIISMSYGECEAVTGATANAAFNSAYENAVVEGISVFVSSGDQGPDVCDRDAAAASHGINVNGWGSTPYNVSVGGTDFGDVAAGTYASYWSATNSATLQSANGYIPEIPWNDSCAGILLVVYEDTVNGYNENPPYGSTGFCNVSGTDFQTTAAGSGGPSGCATGVPSTADEVSGTCAGYPKPMWQSGLFGNPSDGVRDLPDVSLFAANGLWAHFYIFCYSHTGHLYGGAPCTNPPDPTGSTPTWSAAGGTSFSSPILAAIQALVNQRTAALTLSPVPGQGNPNPVYYAIAKTEYGASGSAVCNSSTQPLPRRGVASACVFYDVTQGDIDLNCSFNTTTMTDSPNCYNPGASMATPYNGALSTGAISGLTLTAGGSGYTSAPTCNISAPQNTFAYNGYTGGVPATCTATISIPPSPVNAVMLTNAGAGYAPIPICTLSGGGGSGATCAVSGVTETAYQPAFPATPGWDFATGIGTINAYNLVFSTVWAEGP